MVWSFVVFWAILASCCWVSNSLSVAAVIAEAAEEDSVLMVGATEGG